MIKKTRKTLARKAVKEQVQIVPYESGYLRSLGLFKIVKPKKYKNNETHQIPYSNIYQ